MKPGVTGGNIGGNLSTSGSYPQMPLTDTAIRKAKPGDKAIRMFDERGLYLEIAPGGGKWWRFKFRFDGKEKLLSMGTFPDISLKEARQRRDEARKLIAEGSDPSAQRKAVRHARKVATLNTVEATARAWLEHRGSAWVERTRTIALASLENDVFPVIGDRPINDIQPADIRKLVQGIEARGAGETAGRVFQRLKAIFRYAITHDLIGTDPTYPLKPAEIFKPRKVQHRAALSERDMPIFLQRLAAYEGDPTTSAALTLLMLTALRPGELRGARWDEIDIDRALWRVPAARMKMKTEHTVPLSKQAIDVIESMRPISGRGALVLPSPFYPGKPLSDGTLNSALARMGYKGLATAHGFR
ncbi:MAG TPA: integrase arm-type DNA-binding domain-containing protein, partial [Burkholderiaceae bacterium]|nr:integrase arm-type DNA-binding domain-containing protein [Burkholderiaceae bacterium]